jgi:hypothetical protein
MHIKEVVNMFYFLYRIFNKIESFYMPLSRAEALEEEYKKVFVKA